MNQNNETVFAQLGSLVSTLMSSEERNMSRVGVVTPIPQGNSILSDFSEIVSIDATGSAPPGLACELVIADASDKPVSALKNAVRHLSRDGILVASVPAQQVDAAVQIVAEYGTDWVAAWKSHDSRCNVLAAIDVHPKELGSMVADHVVHLPPSTCVLLPQNVDDRIKRRYIRRNGRSRMMSLAKRLHEIHGEGVRRIITGVEILVGERPTKPKLMGSRPTMFGIPDVNTTPWPDVAKSPRLQSIIDMCNKYAPTVSEEMRNLVKIKTMGAFLQDKYNKNKFQMSDPGIWKGLHLINGREVSDDLPVDCKNTRRLLTELSTNLSGEVTILRLGPGTALPPHLDDYDYEQYIQIGLSIPPECGIRVSGETHHWIEGQPIVFNPGFLHEVWNDADRPRDVLAIDTWHTDLSEIEINALREVRMELDALRAERRRQEKAELAGKTVESP